MARRLGDHEKALWGRVIATVAPLRKVEATVKPATSPPSSPRVNVPTDTKPTSATPVRLGRPSTPATREPTLDGHWNRRIHRGAISPDISVDLHDANLSGAYSRLDGALEQAIAQRLKVVLLVTGKARAHDRASGEGRGAIASVVRDWLAASRHAQSISAVRTAHPRHGGAGALYIVLKS